MIQKLYDIAKAWKMSNRKGWSLLYKVNKLIANIWCPLTQRWNHNAGIDETHEMIVSLTTFPARIDIVWITIASIMNQTYKAGRIILWLAREQFPKEEQDLPKSLLRLKERGLEICFCEDLKPHKKYFYSMKLNPEKCVVTIDDDIIYPEKHLEQLWQTHLRHPEEICCQFAHKITYDEQGNIEAYDNWQSCYGESIEPTLQILPVGCGGVLYPPHVLDENIYNVEDIKTLCPVMDDLWLKSMAVRKGTKAVLCNEGSLIYFDVLGTRESGLYHSNAGEKKNDVAMGAIVEKYPEVCHKLYQDYCSNMLK